MDKDLIDTLFLQFKDYYWKYIKNCKKGMAIKI